MKHTRIYCLLSILVFSNLSCDPFLGAFCSGEDEVTVNKIFVKEFITDQDFKNISLLRNSTYGSDNDFNVLGIPAFEYTLDGKYIVLDEGVLNYGSDTSLFNQSLNLNTQFSDTGFDFLDDYDNKRGTYLSKDTYFMQSSVPDKSDSIFIEVDLAFEYSTPSSIDTIFFTQHEFVNSKTYKVNSIRDIAYAIDGSPILLIDNFTVTFETDNGNFNSNWNITGSYLLKTNFENKIDTLVSTIYSSGNQNKQLKFTSTKAGLLVGLDNDVYLLDQDKKLNYLFSNELNERLPNQSNLNGTAVFGNSSNQYYNFETGKLIDLNSRFHGTNSIIYGYPSNNHLIALRLSGNSSSNKNQEKIFIYDTNSESLVDSITFDDLSEFDIVDDYDFIEGTYAKLAYPVFTPDDRLIFMYVYEEKTTKCAE